MTEVPGEMEWQENWPTMSLVRRETEEREVEERRVRGEREKERTEKKVSKKTRQTTRCHTKQSTSMGEAARERATVCIENVYVEREGALERRQASFLYVLVHCFLRVSSAIFAASSAASQF